MLSPSPGETRKNFSAGGGASCLNIGSHEREESHFYYQGSAANDSNIPWLCTEPANFFQITVQIQNDQFL